MKKILKALFSLIIALIFTIFAVKNSQVVPIDLWPLPFQFNLTLSLVILGAFIGGMIGGGFLVWLSSMWKLFYSKYFAPSKGSLSYPRDLEN